MKKRETYDVVIIGAGASGLIAADVCGAGSLKVLLLEGKPKPGLKLLITGGGRCNITNTGMHPAAFHTSHPRTVKNVLAAFPLRKTLDYFKRSGMEFQEENDGCLFPETQSAKTVMDALLKRLDPNVTLRVSSKADTLTVNHGLFRVTCGSVDFHSRAVLLCAGGCSYPRTGSDGSGYNLARMLGHSIVSPNPALTPLATDDPEWKTLAGISLPCRLRLKRDPGPDARFEGPLLFTHFGFSGPCVMNISRFWIQNPEQPVVANFLPAENDSSFRDKIVAAASDYPRRMVKTWLSEFLPARLAEVLMEKANLDQKQVTGQVTRKEREELIRCLIRCPLPISAALGYNKAEVTSGGVDLSEVNPKTLESVKVPRLFFAGEILDVDGPIGGYNLQWAWSSGYVAGMGAVKALKQL